MRTAWSVILITTCVLFLGSAQAQSGQVTPEIEVLGNRWSTIDDVETRYVDGQLVVTGTIRKSGASRSRRFYKPIWAESSDQDNRVRHTSFGRIYRFGGARHTTRAHFEIRIDAERDDLSTLRLGYGWHS